MDINRLGKQGLFEDIAAGLSQTKLVVAFISDEYAKSDNCNMEITHSVKNLRIPTIVCAIGDPNKTTWLKTKVGMIVGNCELILMRTQFEYDANIVVYDFILLENFVFTNCKNKTGLSIKLKIYFNNNPRRQQHQ